MATAFFKKLRDGMQKTREGISRTLDGVVSTFKKIDEDFLEELEEVLVMADVGAVAAGALIEELRKKAKEGKITDTSDVKELLKDIIAEMMADETPVEEDKSVLLIVGVNGVGKTTSIGKIAHMNAQQGKKVIIAAGDTFRAAAAEQLEEWGRRANVPVIRHQEGADPSAVVFDAIHSAKAKNADMLICDTAGRLQTKKNLMEELKKISRVIEREYPEARCERLLVIDATTGQNAISQVKIFNETVLLDGIILTKLDGTAKGGIVLAIKKELGIPVRFIGVGEKIDDLQPFDAKDFAEAIL
ncbi:MAG: signal recognition particle-docking protein FtsY [Christensenellales bacterium]|jgi:fused signal recognition particle receptor